MKILATLLALIFSLNACAQEEKVAQPESKEYLEGKDYTLLEQPVRTADPNKIEVAEVFAYSCPHCFHFESLLHAWAQQQKPDVQLVQTHAMWSPQMENMVRGYYTSVALKIKDKTHMAVFNSWHLAHKPLQTPEEWAEFFSGFGVDKEKALGTFNSFGVTSQIKQAEARVRGYRITGTPELVVEGKYRISSSLAGGQAEMLTVADFLIAKERTARASKVAPSEPVSKP